MRLIATAWLIPLTLLLGAAPASAQLPWWRPAANPDPLRLASFPFDPAMAADPGPGRWDVFFSLSYVNLWADSGQLAALRRPRGETRQPVLPDELRDLERLYPGASIYHLDLEGWRSDLYLSRGLWEGTAVTLHLPWMEVGRPHWDAIAERWHSLAGLPNADREVFPRGGSLVYLRGPGGTIERRGLDTSGLGDVGVALSLAAGHWLGATHRAVLSLEAPTGRRGTLLGSGGWDLGARWFAAWEGRRTTLLAGAGYTRLAAAGALLGARRDDLWHLMGGLDWRLRPSLTASLRVLWERSPLAAFLGSGQSARPALSERFGVAAPITARTWLAFEMGQDWNGAGIAPDYSFHLTMGWKSQDVRR